MPLGNLFGRTNGTVDQHSESIITALTHRVRVFRLHDLLENSNKKPCGCKYIDPNGQSELALIFLLRKYLNIIKMSHIDRIIIHHRLFVEDDWGRTRSEGGIFSRLVSVASVYS